MDSSRVYHLFLLKLEGYTVDVGRKDCSTPSEVASQQRTHEVRWRLVHLVSLDHCLPVHLVADGMPTAASSDAVPVERVAVVAVAVAAVVAAAAVVVVVAFVLILSLIHHQKPFASI